MRIALASALITSTLALAGPARAADICQAAVLKRVAAQDNPKSFLNPGDTDGAITQYRVNKMTGNAVFCSHGGYCYPTHVVISGQKLEALKLTNCHVDMTKGDSSDPDEIYYRLNVIRSKIAPARLRRDDIENKLLEMGLCSACAGNAATIYTTQPQSRCGKLTRRALEGDPVATKSLVDGPGYCS